MTAAIDTADPSAWARRLLTMLDDQRALLQELETLAAQQAQLIAESRTEALLELLGKRQGIIDRFLSSQTELTRLTDGKPADRADLDEPTRTRIRESVAGIDAALARVAARDEADQQQLQTLRDGTRSEIAAIDTTRTARQAYRQGAGAGPRYADQRG